MQLVGFARSLIKVIGLVALFNAWVAVQIVAFMILVGLKWYNPNSGVIWGNCCRHPASICFPV
ncbi:MAG: hypothetical protein HZY76_22965 [Anaerolineae bacterium]|nr:MAG: hypothetical protein HZY76_22965 [Anaerolineae bacterium]